MAHNNRCGKSGQSGFGLVEVMVALVIGLLSTLVITQVLTVFEGQKRSTSGTADAQTNGSLALYALQREAQMAGYGLPVFDTVNPALNCAVFTPATDPLTTLPTNIYPVTITAGASAKDSDRLTVRYGDSQFAGVPVLMLAGTTGAVAQIDTTMGCQVGNDVLVTSGTSCALTKAATVASAVAQVTLASSSNVAAGSKMSCLGTWRQIEFSVNATNQLERHEMVSGVADVVTPIGSDIVAIKAQYGISAAANNNQVTTWATAQPADRNTIKAIRVAVVARNSLLGGNGGAEEKNANLTAACSSTTAAAPTGLCAWEGSAASPAPQIDLSNDANWRHYRYRVFETVIPLRNVVWSKDTMVVAP